MRTESPGVVYFNLFYVLLVSIVISLQQLNKFYLMLSSSDKKGASDFHHWVN